MNGLLGYLENSTGRYLANTEQAFALIGATRTASVLQQVSVELGKLGVTTATMQTNLQKLAPYQVTTFSASHGPVGDALADAVAPLSASLYLNGRPEDRVERPFDLLEDYAVAHFGALLEQVAPIYAPDA